MAVIMSCRCMFDCHGNSELIIIRIYQDTLNHNQTPVDHYHVHHDHCHWWYAIICHRRHPCWPSTMIAVTRFISAMARTNLRPWGIVGHAETNRACGACAVLMLGICDICAGSNNLGMVITSILLEF